MNIENSYVAILQHDKAQIKHPITGKTITLYRIIATKSFTVKGENINIYQIGGWIESISNLDPNIPTWIDHSSKVYDDALVSNSLVKGTASIFQKSKVFDSLINDKSLVFGNSQVTNSNLSGLVIVKEDAVISDCILTNSAIIYGNANVSGTKMTRGAVIYGNSVVKNSEVHDMCEVRGDTILTNCILNGRYIAENERLANQTLTNEPTLNIYEEVIDNPAY